MLPLSRHIWSQKYSKLVSIEACMVEWMEKLLQPVLLNFAIILKGLCDGRLPSDSALGRFSPKFYKSCDLAQSMILRTIFRHLNWLEDIWWPKIVMLFLELAPSIVGRPTPAPVPPILLVILRLLNRIPYLEHGAAKHEYRGDPPIRNWLEVMQHLFS